MYSDGHVRRVLDAAGIYVSNDMETHLSVHCPYHHNVNTPAGEISKELGLFYCFSCHKTAQFVDYLCKAATLTHFQAMRLIEGKKVKLNLDDEIRSLFVEKEIPAVSDDLIEGMHKNAMASDRALSFFAGRGISEESIIRHKFGYSAKQDMITMPFKSPNGDRYIGFEGRSVEGKRFKAQGPKTKTLFNLNNVMWSKSVFVTESIMDCILLEQVGASAVAKMGTGVGQRQVDLLTKYFNKIYIVQDNDTSQNDFAGQMSAKKLLDKIGKRGIIVVPPKGCKDVGDMSNEQIAELIARTENLVEGI